MNDPNTKKRAQSQHANKKKNAQHSKSLCKHICTLIFDNLGKILKANIELFTKQL